MPTNRYFSRGTSNEQNLVEDLIIESLQMYGQDLYYIPRTLVSVDDILGEDRLSEFKSHYPVEMYLKGADFGGQGAYIDKFGLGIDQSATFIVARRRWSELVGSFGKTIIPDRPCEGDLIYYPQADSLFEIQFVEHQNPFYQLGKLYVWELSVELFRYSSERLDTGLPAVDAFESLKTFSTDPADSPFGVLNTVQIDAGGAGYTTASAAVIGDGSGAEVSVAVNNGSVVSIAIVNKGMGYTTASIQITGDGSGAAASATLIQDISKPDGFGKNPSFEAAAKDIVFDEHNPFGGL